MNKIYSLFVIPIFWLAGSFDCAPDFQLEASLKTKAGDYALQLELVRGESAEYTLDLYDFNTGKIIATEHQFFSEGEKKVVFRNVRPSTYTVYFSSSSCPKKKALKGPGTVLQ